MPNLFGGDDVSFDVHGGSATVRGSGTAEINGLVLAGLRRHRSLTLDYTADDCDIQISACLANPVDGEIGYQREIRFPRTKLAALGLGSFNADGDFVPNQFIVHNPAVIQFQIDAEKGKLAIVNQTMAASSIVFTEEGDGLADNVTGA